MIQLGSQRGGTGRRAHFDDNLIVTAINKSMKQSTRLMGIVKMLSQLKHATDQLIDQSAATRLNTHTPAKY